MKIGFLVHRNAYYQFLGTIIDEALRRGHEVVCLHDYSQPKTGPKGYNFPYLEKAPTFIYGQPEMLSFHNYDGLIQTIREKDIQLIVSHIFLPQYNDVYQILKRHGIFWVTTQYFLDGFLLLPDQSIIPDRDLFYSDIWSHWAAQYILKEKFHGESTPQYVERFQSSARSVGFPELDQLSLIDPEKVRREWDIPRGKPVVLLLPSPSYGYSFWRRFVYGMNSPLIQLPAVLLSLKFRYLQDVWHRWNDANVIKAIRKFCDNNDAYLLVKSREKDPVRDNLSSVADRVLYDESYYPATILKCLSISHICIHFCSSTVIEATSMRVPTIFIAPERQELANMNRQLAPMLMDMLFDYMHYPGVSYKLSIPEAIQMLPESRLQDFPMDLNRQTEYVRKFLGYADGKSSSRVLDEIEGLVK